MDIKQFTSVILIGLLIVIIKKLTNCITNVMSHNYLSTSKHNSTSEMGILNESIFLTTELYENNTTLKYNVLSWIDDNVTASLEIWNSTEIENTMLTSEEITNYTRLGKKKLNEALKILDSGVWTFVRRTTDGDSIFIRRLPDGHNVFRLTGVINIPVDQLFYILHNGLEDYPKWNPSFLECKVLKILNHHTDISYQVTAAGIHGYVASRDFVTLRYWTKIDNNYLSGTYSVDYKDAPEDLDYTRGEHGPGCWELRPLKSNPSQTEFRWLLNTRLNGWLPQLVVDNAFKKFMEKYMVFLRQYCTNVKKKEQM
uniref:START domain-containing protein n=1 Tax=Clastoptera arizonana TaxID=38151 RepID=A0A1B6E1N1_9HEMI